MDVMEGEKQSLEATEIHNEGDLIVCCCIGMKDIAFHSSKFKRVPLDHWEASAIERCGRRRYLFYY